MLTLQQLHAWLPGSTLVGDPEAIITRIHTDSRSIQYGDLFVALRGEHFDGNAFLAEAIAKGAVAVIASNGLNAKSIQGLEVKDAKLALGRIAACWRAQFDLKLIAITGSNGKTTVTQMVASILKAYVGEQSLATVGNFNNDIGVPLTLLRLNASHKIAVVELGMNHPGEIAYLAEMVKPDVALVNNAQREHLEFMVTVEAVAKENGSVFKALSDTGIAVYPADDSFQTVWETLAQKRKTITFAFDDGATQAEISITQADWIKGRWKITASTPVGVISYRLNIAGKHNVKNSLAAISCALAANIPIAAISEGLQAFTPVRGRSFTKTIDINGHTVLLIDDTYNSNPDSMKVAIDALAEMPGAKLLVMGDMGEVGDQGLAFHSEAGDYAQQKGIDHFFTIGTLSKSATKKFEGAQHFDSVDDLIAAVSDQLSQVSSILVKGSRFMKMERISNHIMNFDQEKNQINNNKKLKETLNVT